MKTIEFVSPLGHEIIAALKELGGTGTSAEIGQKIGRSPRSAASALCLLRGMSIVSDGAVSRIIRNPKGVVMGVAFSDPAHPIKWQLISEDGREASTYEQENFKRKDQQ